MRIAIVSDAIYPYNTGGKETRIFELSTRLAANGHDVDIYTMHWWDTPAKTRIENGVRLHAISPLYPLYAGERRSIREGILFGLACFKLLTRRFDVVDVDHMPFFPLFSVRIIAWIKRKPMIATWHEVWGSKYWQEYMGPLGRVASLIERLSVLLPTRIIAVSDMTAGLLQSQLNVTQPPKVVRNGVNLTEIKGIRAQRSTSDVIYAGRLLEHKHVDVLLRAVARLKRTQPQITCFIVGDGPERTSLETLSVHLGLENNVRFFGFLPQHSDVYGYMKSSRAFVLPSTREGFGITVIEANACGIPVITISHPANAARDLITPVTGRLAKLTPADLAKEIEYALANTATAGSIRAAVAQYGWQASALELQKAYTL